MAHSKSELKKAKNLLNKYAPKGEQLAYINPKEANLLKSKGGSGEMTKAGIRSYRSTGYSDYSSPSSSTASTSSSSRSSGGQSNNSNNNDNEPKNLLSRIGSGIVNYIKRGGLIGMGLTAIGKEIKEQRGKKGFNPNLSPSIGSANKTFNQMKSGGYYISDNGGNYAPLAKNVGGRIIKLSPTTAEMSQSSATDVTYDSRKTKAKGRSMMIQTSSRGINRNNTLTLGKPSLLGA